MPARERPKPTIEPAREALRAVVRREVGGEIAHEAGEIALRDDCGRLAHQHRAGAEALDDKTEPGELFGMIVDKRRRVLVEIDDQRRKQRLPLDRAAVAR